MNKKSSDLVGKTVHGYKIIKSIGQGKFSQVYRAETENKIPYALKNIKIFDMADQKSRDKCLKEVEIMKPLDHPNIIKYIDSFIQNNQLYIVTEWAEKGDLKKLIKEHAADENPFDQPTIWEYMYQISSALKHMHQKKIMHRDLKPANIFISQDMTLKIGDLGLGRVFGSETLQAYSKVGTPLYMSPQLIQDSGYNFNADVWSLGCICYQLCELNSPFRNKQEKMSLMDLFENITKCNYKPISSRYSPQLSQVIKRMIVVDPNYRLSSQQVFQTAEKNLKGIKKPLLDPLIVMDDIYIKLNLLDYSTYFCKPAERKPINKFYFAFEDRNSKQNDQLYYFLELCYWIIALSKPGQKKQKIAIITKANIDWNSPQNACRKLLSDLENAGIRLEQIGLQSIINGYGQSTCYILNEVLNRELIRMNFQFRGPQQSPISNLNQEKQQIQGDEKEQQLQGQIQKISQSSESIQQQSQFQQSIFYKKGNKKLGNEDLKLLEKIQQYGGQDEEKDMITGKVEEKQWKAQCLRVEKYMNEITTYAKQARKKFGHQNFQSIKVNSSKITDLIRAVKPIATVLSNKIQEQLQQIKKGQGSIRQSFQNIGDQYSQRNQQLKILSTQSIVLSNSLKQKLQIYSRVEQKLAEVTMKINLTSTENENNKAGDIKKSIKDLQAQLKQLETKQRILQWQLRTSIMNQQKGEGRSRRNSITAEFAQQFEQN